ncbi:TPA: sulfite exporter TauE/SafE family protein [Staphylococcus pseudintermedius]|nr:sulfite exporter TauE/SafE family protein [Staphylococcus pseudintermedius]
MLYIFLSLLGIIGGILSGMVGIGGAIIIYPALLIIPPMLGLPSYNAYIASGLTSAQVFFSTLSSSIRARQKPDFSLKLILWMGSSMLIGSALGATIAEVLTERFVNSVYVVIAILALVLIMIKIKPQTEANLKFSKVVLLLTGLVIGAISGVIGAGGAFIIIPVLLVFFKIPMHTVVANSVVIAFISSIGAFMFKLFQGYIPLGDALFLVVGSMLFAPLGLKIGRQMPEYVQKVLVALLIIVSILNLIF